MISLGFEHREDRDAKEEERDYWWLLYEGGAMIIMGHASPDGMLSIWPPTRDATSLEGEYIYGVKTSYRSPWDWLGAGWRNTTWLFVSAREAPQAPRLGFRGLVVSVGEPARLVSLSFALSVLITHNERLGSNDNGEIVGSFTTSTPGQQGFIASPIPEPGTLSLLAKGW